MTINTAITTLFVAAIFCLAPAVEKAQAQTATAYFSGGCFWCTEHDFEKINGVTDVISGYMGGHVKDPSYKEVASGTTGHYEVVKVVYDRATVSYQNLLSAFWRMHDPSDGGGSFCDRGQQYSTAAFYGDVTQKALLEGAVAALNAANKFTRPVATKILPVSGFTPAEAYHQDYAKRNPVRYNYYRYRCGRDQFIEKTWAGDDRVYQSAQ
ncbi:MAG: peptide-methionine (S)-S-oxide reductase MsrA [Parvibaculales bacterium]